MLPKSVKNTPSMSTARTGAKRKSNPSSEARRPLKRSRRTEPSISEEINPNVCCMCFSTYEMTFLKELGWTGYFVHVVGGYMKTAEDRELDDQGKECFGPYCIVYSSNRFTVFVIPVHGSEI